jgi:hypothetical protein
VIRDVDEHVEDGQAVERGPADRAAVGVTPTDLSQRGG